MINLIRYFIALNLFLFASNTHAMKAIIFTSGNTNSAAEIEAIENELSALYLHLSQDSIQHLDLNLLPYPKLIVGEKIVILPLRVDNVFWEYAALWSHRYPHKNIWKSNFSTRLPIESGFAHDTEKWGGSWVVFSRKAFEGVIKTFTNYQKNAKRYVGKKVMYKNAPHRQQVMGMAAELVLMFSRDQLRQINDVEDCVIDGMSEALQECEEALLKECLPQFDR